MTWFSGDTAETHHQGKGTPVVGPQVMWFCAVLACSALAGLTACKTRGFQSIKVSGAEGGGGFARDPMATDPCKDKPGGRFRGKFKSAPYLLGVFGKPDDASRPTGPSAAKRNASTPWVDWQFFEGVDGQLREPGSFARWLGSLAADRNNTFIANLAGALQGPGTKLRDSQSRVAAEVGILAALLNLEMQRIDLLECSMWDTGGAVDTYNPGKINENRDQTWPAYQFAARSGQYKDEAGNDKTSCSDKDRKYRSLDGTCNALDNPTMGAVGQRFPRNVSFAAARVTPASPDVGVISDRLLARPDSQLALKRASDLSAEEWEKLQSYRKAPFFNLLAASWIQFMTHDWFSHANRGRNDDTRSVSIGKGRSAPATIKDPSPDKPPVSSKYAAPGVGTTANTVTFWWDASQIYGWDAVTASRVRKGQSRYLLTDSNKMLPTMEGFCRGEGGPQAAGLHPHECGQGVSAFTDNWWMGITLLQTAFVREHNRFVDGLAQRMPGLSEEELYQHGRLYIAALIAKIHTIEWTPQLLFNPVLEKAMESNWHGIIGSRFGTKKAEVEKLRAAVGQVVQAFNRRQGSASERLLIPSPLQDLGKRGNNFLFAFLAAFPGITTINTNFFGSPYALPAEFTAVYRLHSLIPDVIEKRSLGSNGQIEGGENEFVPLLTRDLVLDLADKSLSKDNVGDWLVTMGTQRTGTLQLRNYPRFMHSLNVQQNKEGQKIIDLAALEIVRDRERGVPRHSEFRANIGLEPLRDFNDFLDMENAFQAFRGCGSANIEQYSDFQNRLTKTAVESLSCADATAETRKQVLLQQIEERDLLKEIYGGNINAVDTLVGWLAENTRPYGYALAETQFQIFILNASRRLFSDRFFTDDFRPEVYTEYGMDQLRTRGMLDVLADNFTEVNLDKLLRDGRGRFRVANAFDPWTRPRKGFALDWGYDPVNLQGAASFEK